MKANFKYALMVAAALAFVACKPSTDPKDPNDQPGDEPGEEFVSPIDVHDNSLADWDALPAGKVASATCAATAQWKALKSVKAYADKMYLNVVAEFDEALIADREWVPFHIYFNADADPATGGYGAEWAEADCEFMLEDAVMSAGEPYNYNPAVFQWFGGEGGGMKDQTDPNGWNWTDPNRPNDEADGWGAIVATGSLPISNSQIVGNKIEIQILRELIPYPFADTFYVGFDIQQNWNSVGVLPNADDDAEGNHVLASKLKVTIDK